ncbi:hypothetical protein O3Q50_06510 [Enterococcus lactis]|nr:hypothetical protein [Enterococcus lactis]
MTTEEQFNKVASLVFYLVGFTSVEARIGKPFTWKRECDAAFVTPFFCGLSYLKI